MGDVLSIEDVEDVIENVFNHIRIQILNKNRLGELDYYLEQIGYQQVAKNQIIENEDKILVIGNSKVRKNDLVKIVNKNGLVKSNFEFILNYEDIEKFDFETLVNTNKYSFIMVGPMGHKQKGIRGYSSAITFLEYEEGCPQTVRVLNTSQELEITKSSFNMALEGIKILMSS